MIIGLGIDYVDIRRICNLLENFPRFAHRIFTTEEQAYAEKNPYPAAIYAKRFAAKEAFIKASGKKVVPFFSWKDVFVEHETHGTPFLNFSPRGWSVLQEHFGNNIKFHLSLTDEPPYAAAFVIMERISAP